MHGRQVEKAVQLRLQVRGLFIDLLDGLPRLHQGGARLERACLGNEFGPSEALRGPRLDSPHGQKTPVQLLDAARHFANPFLLLRLGDLLVRLGDLHSLTDLEQVRQRLHHAHVGEGRVLIQDGNINGDGGKRRQRPSPRPADRSSLGGQDGAQVVVEVQVHRGPDHLREIVRLRGLDREGLALGVQGGEVEQLVVRQRPLLGLVQSQMNDSRLDGRRHGCIGGRRLGRRWSGPQTRDVAGG